MDVVVTPAMICCYTMSHPLTLKAKLCGIHRPVGDTRVITVPIADRFASDWSSRVGGPPVAYDVFEGNRHDGKTLQEIVTAMEKRHGCVGRIWVLHRGTVSDENIALDPRVEKARYGQSCGAMPG